MNRQELIANRRAVARCHMRLTIFHLGGVFALLIAGARVDDYLTEAHSIAHSIFVLAILPAILLLVASLVWQLKRAFRKNNLLCPVCKARLDGSNGQVAVATGICGECGNHIIEECGEHS